MDSKNYYKITKISVRVVLHLFLIGLGLIMILPFIWMIISSFKPPSEIISIPFKFWPEVWTLSNYIKVFKEISIGRGFLNSIVVASIITLFVLFTSSSVGYLFAKLRFRGREVLFVYVIASIMIPPYVGIVPLYYLVAKMHILDSYIGLVFPFLFSAFGIFIMRQFIKGIPNSLIDSARIDGADDFRIYLKVILPLTRSAFAVLGILTFLWSWDEFLWPLVVVNSNEYRTLPLLLSRFRAAETTFYGSSIAAASIVIIPVLIIYAFFQRHFVKGMALTGLKE